jgi:hypothetical protein
MLRKVIKAVDFGIRGIWGDEAGLEGKKKKRKRKRKGKGKERETERERSGFPTKNLCASWCLWDFMPKQCYGG